MFIDEKLRSNVGYHRTPGVDVLLGPGAAEAAVALLAAAGGGALVVATGGSGRRVVVAVVLALQPARRLSARTMRGRLLAVATLPAVGVLAALIGAAFRVDLALGDALVIAALALAPALRRGPPAVSRAGR